MIPQVSPHTDVIPTAGYRINSPLLYEHLYGLPEDGYFQFLDVTPATPGLLAFFAQFHCRLYLPGCVDELWRMDSDKLQTADLLQTALSQNLRLAQGKPARLDVILLWDLINYLQQPVVTALIEYLLAYTCDTTVIHSYIHTRQSMPAAPGRYQFTADGGINVETQTDSVSVCPAYYQEVLHKLMKPFVVQRSILLSNGVQEYLFQLPRRRSEFF